MLRRLPLLVFALLLIGTLALCNTGAAVDEPAQSTSIPSAGEPTDSLDRDYAKELPRIAPVEPADVLSTFEVRPGFRMELVAAEPLVNSPVAMAFDADGRLYVVEMRGYSEQPDDGLGRIKLLTDRNGDGRFDDATVFVDKLSWPTAVFCYDGGIFIADAPDLLYAKDTNGDGVADERETVFTGFGKSNVQGLVNSLSWDLDNRIHGATSSSGAKLRKPDQPEDQAQSFNGRDFAFDPKTRTLVATSGGGQHGMTFDDWGTKFVCHNSDHIQQIMVEDRYLARNPYLAAPSSRKSIAADGPQAEVFRISPVEPWRIVRTRLRMKGVVPGIVEGGGRAAGYFTSATGVTIFRGDAWPKEYSGSAFVGDVGSNIVHRKTIDTNRIAYVAKRADTDKENASKEFLASRDIWFRPCQFANAPDGSLYVLDVYREVIEHPASLPPIIKKHLDLTSGQDRGRIYRIVPEDHKQRGLPKLSQATTAELVKTLEHPNAWHRETAARLLYQKQDKEAVPLLEKLAAESESPLGRMHALYALQGLDALSAARITAALGDDHPRVRQHAVRLAERRASDGGQELTTKLLALANDPDIHVRYQLAFTLGEPWGEKRIETLGQLALREASDPWMRLAIQSSLAKGAANVFAKLMADPDYRASAAGRELVLALARQIGRQQQTADLQIARRALEQISDGNAASTALSMDVLLALAESSAGRDTILQWTSSEESPLHRQLVANLERATKTASDDAAKLAQRRSAIRSLSLDKFEHCGSALASLLGTRQPQEIQLAALETLGTFTDPAVADGILEAWPGLSPAVRRQAIELLLARPERIGRLLDAIAEQKLAPSELEAARIEQLRNQSDPMLRERATALLGTANLARRQSVVDQYRPALELSGDRDRGREAFRKHCAVCHKIEGFGHEIGPNLATVQNRGPESILLNVLDPNREVNPQYVNYTLVTDDGRTVTGMISAETATGVTLVRAESASDTVLRVNIDDLRSTSLSLMPEGLEKEIDPQMLADVIAYLTSLN